MFTGQVSRKSQTSGTACKRTPLSILTIFLRFSMHTYPLQQTPFLPLLQTRHQNVNRSCVYNLKEMSSKREGISFFLFPPTAGQSEDVTRATVLEHKKEAEARRTQDQRSRNHQTSPGLLSSGTRTSKLFLNEADSKYFFFRLLQGNFPRQ